MIKTIGEVLEAYNNDKEGLQSSVKDLIDKARSLGWECKKDDAHLALQFLLGYRRGRGDK